MRLRARGWVMEPWDEDGMDLIPEQVRLACRDGRVQAGLAEIFRRNSGGAPAERRQRAQTWAAEALVRILEPAAACTVDVGPLRLHLAVPSPLYPGQACIYASAWDDDDGVWRQVGALMLPQADQDG